MSGQNIIYTEPEKLTKGLWPKSSGKNRVRFLEHTEIFFGLAPIDHIPPRVDIIGPLILVFQIISVLPDIKTQYRGVFFIVHHGAVLVRRTTDMKLAVIAAQPDPAA